MSLAEYRRKRNFKATPEPGAQVKRTARNRFVVQRHDATRLHYDFRLEMAGVLKSWAVPKGPSMNPADKRLAVMVEDHPVSYIDFYGSIPEGNYGAGTVDIWDQGNFVPVDPRGNPISEKEGLATLKAGNLKFRLDGKHLKGEFALVRLKDDKNWLLIKHRDKNAVDDEYIAEDHKPVKGHSRGGTWSSNRSSTKNKTALSSTRTTRGKSLSKTAITPKRTIASKKKVRQK